MSMAIIGVVGTVASVGATVYATQQQKKQAALARAKAGMGTSGLAFGDKVKAAEYQPVDFSQEQWNSIHQNLNSLNDSIDLSRRTNAGIDADAMRRAMKFIPNYKQNMLLEGNASNDLLSGRLPYDDALDVVANRSGFTNAIGTPGTAAPATLRDLGLSRLDAIKAGGGLMKDMVNIAETVNPVGRRSNPKDMFMNPTDRIKLMMEQNQLVQQSDQSRNNLEAGIAPGDQAATQLALAQRLGVIGGPPGGAGGADYSQAISGLVSGLGSAYSKYQAGAGGGGGYSMASDPGLVATGGSFGGVPSYTNRIGSGGGTYNLSARPYNIPAI